MNQKSSIDNEKNKKFCLIIITGLNQREISFNHN